MTSTTGPVILVVLRTGMVLCLYLFLAVVIYTQWKSFSRGNRKNARKRSGDIFLFVKDEQNIVSRHFKKGTVSLGRDHNCDCVLTHESVNSLHAYIYTCNNRWWIRRHDSSEGISVDDKAVSLPRALKSGSIIRCGDVMIVAMIDD